jgi:hypothetical protein
MALYKEADAIRKSESEIFDRVLRDGTVVAYEGIYRCLTCNVEIAAIGGKPFPSAHRHPHTAGCKVHRWQLLVAV